MGDGIDKPKAPPAPSAPKAPADASSAKILKFADKISNLRSLATSPPADWPMQRHIDYVIWTTEVVQGLRGESGLLEQDSIGQRRMLSGQFPWRQKAAERRCRIADATIAIVFVAIDGGLAWSGTGSAVTSNSA